MRRTAMFSTGRQRSRRGVGVMVLGLALLLAACGGEPFRNADSGTSTSADVNTNTNTNTNPNTNTVAAANVLPMVIDGGPSGRATNVPYATLTICTPGSTTQCQTLKHVLVDTGSTGLRIVSSALAPSLRPASVNNAAGEPLAQCFAFVDGTVWGRLRSVDVVLGTERLSGLPIQVIGDESDAALAGTDCAGPFQNTVEAFGANGVLGISTFVQDCGTACAVDAASSLYYRCPTTGCVRTRQALAEQVHNPVAKLPTDNNGVVITMPAVPIDGVSTATGALILGINTRSNNQLPASAPILTLNRNDGYLSATYKGVVLAKSFFDTGSNFYFFDDSSLPQCTEAGYTRYYCPTSTLNRSATVTGANARTATVDFKLANVYQKFSSNKGHRAFDGFAATTTISGSFDFGAPFYFGKSVYTAFEGDGNLVNTAAGVNGPWVAF